MLNECLSGTIYFSHATGTEIVLEVALAEREQGEFKYGFQEGGMRKGEMCI